MTAHLGTSTVAELKYSGSCTAVCSAAEACSSSSCTHGIQIFLTASQNLNPSYFRVV